MYDVIIIGAGIVGCAAARALSRYKLRVLVLEERSDVSCGASKANSGILHAGYDCAPGTLKASLNVRGVEMYKNLAGELDIPLRNNGSLVICLEDDELPKLRELRDRGVKNNVPGLRVIDGGETLRLEPNLNERVKAALYAPSAGVVSPYEAAVAFAENAASNGVNFMLDTEVTGVTRTAAGQYQVQTGGGVFQTRAVINAAGVNSAAVNNFLGLPVKEEILPQRGQYYLLDNTQRDLVTRTIFQLPTRLGKGVLVVPTYDYNILFGPTAETPDDPRDTSTTPEGLDEVVKKVSLILKNPPVRERITAFAGVRAKHASEDFVLNEPSPGFFNAIGIDSPGLSAAPAVAEYITGKAAAFLQPGINADFNPRRECIKRFKHLTFEQQAELVKADPAYGRVVCRCETVTEGEITDALRRPLGARNLDAIKRRVRAQAGRCQGGFCTARLLEILSRELNISEEDVLKDEPGSNVLFRHI